MPITTHDSSQVSEGIDFSMAETQRYKDYLTAKAAEVIAWNTWIADKTNKTNQAAWLLTSTAVQDTLELLGAGVV